MTRESSSSPEAGVRKYRRSRSGCFTCRKRKKRCDEKKPICTACKRLNLTCKYPSGDDSDRYGPRGASNGNKIDAFTQEKYQWTDHPRMTHSEVLKDANDNPIRATNGSDLDGIDLNSDLHFPLHFSRMDGEVPSLPPATGSYDSTGREVTKSNVSCREHESDGQNHNGTHRTHISGEDSVQIATMDSVSLSTITQQINGDPFDGQAGDDVGQLDSLSLDGALGDFLTPLLFPPEVNGIPGHSAIMRDESPAALFPPLSVDGNNLTVVDELTDPFASALTSFPRTPSSTPSSSRNGSTDIFKGHHKNNRGLNGMSADTDVHHSSNFGVSQFPASMRSNSITSANSGTPPLSLSPELPTNKIHDNELSYQSLASAGPTTDRFCAVYPDLDGKSVSLYNYFRDKQSILMSVSPLNYFRSVFLAFSLRYRAIMYGILAWAAWHKGDEEELARIFFERGSQILRNETINSRSKEEILAALLVLASAKICSGDTSAWRAYLVMAGETIHLHGGLTSFMESESVRWLLKNFAYHEILTSSSLSQPKLFSANDFELIFNQPSSATLPDTLCACCQPVFVVLERINELTRSVRLMKVDDKLSEVPDKDVESIYLAAHDLEQKIWALRPAHKILQHLSDSDLLLQQTLFDVFKLVAVLHMYQSVLQINSASISMRVVAQRLEHAMDELFGTMVEGILTFPLFILGISSSTSRAREYVVKKFTAMEKRLHARNVTQARVLLRRVWDRDHHGKLHVDWNELVDRDGLHFCFC